MDARRVCPALVFVGCILTFQLSRSAAQDPGKPQHPDAGSPAGAFDDPGAQPSNAMGSVGVRGSIDSGGYAAPAVVRVQTQLADDILRAQLAALKPVYSPSFSIPCSREQFLLNAAKEHPGKHERIALGKFYLQHGNPNLAMVYLEPALLLEPTDSEIVTLCATALIQVRDFRRAISILQSLPGAGRTVKMQQLLGIALEGQGRLEAAEQEFHAAAIHENTPTTVFAWGSILLLLGQNDRAMQACRGTTGSQSALLSLVQAVASYNLGRPEQALAALFQIAEADPASEAPYRFIVGVLHGVSSADLSFSSERLRHLSQRAPNNAWASYAFAVALLAAVNGAPDRNQSDEVERILTRALSRDSELADAHYQLASLYASRQEKALAIAEYCKALHADPTLIEAHYRLGQLYLRTGQKELARQELSQHQTPLDRQKNTSREMQVLSHIDLRSTESCP